MPRPGFANPIDQHVGSRVRIRRLMLGMSQERLGEALGLTFQQVQKYEKGVNRIGAGRLQEISQILRVPVAFFFEDAPSASVSGVSKNAAEPTPVMDFMATSEGMALAKAFMRITNKQLRRRLADLVVEMGGGTLQ